jgi:hypothetical protein
MCGRSRRTGWARTAKARARTPRPRVLFDKFPFAHCRGSPASGFAHCDNSALRARGSRFQAKGAAGGPHLRVPPFRAGLRPVARERLDVPPLGANSEMRMKVLEQTSLILRSFRSVRNGVESSPTCVRLCVDVTKAHAENGGRSLASCLVARRIEMRLRTRSPRPASGSRCAHGSTIDLLGHRRTRTIPTPPLVCERSRSRLPSSLRVRAKSVRPTTTS